MDSDSEKHLAPDEMYLMLQADMINIKKQEQALQSEIEEIAAKFKSLLESCGLEGEFPASMAPPSPSLVQNSLTYVTACTTTTSFGNISPEHMNIPPEHMLSSSTSEESLFPTNPMCSLAESEDASIDCLVLEESKSKTFVLDNNSNYLNSSHSDSEKNMDHTPTIEILHSMEFTDNSNSSSPSSTSIQSSVQDSTSDGYPKSDDSSDNQVVPECYDLDKEFMSRLQYYSDFTIDRQRKINSMVCQLSKSNNNSHSSAFAEELFTRHVEGAESSHSPVRAPLKTYSSSSGGSSENFSTSRSRRGKKSIRDRTTSSRSSRKSTSVPIASSTMLDDSFMSGSSGRSSQRSTSSSNPIASSTLLDEAILFSSGSKMRSSMVTPKASSTMIEETILSQASSLPRSSNIVHSASMSELQSEMPSTIGPNDEGSLHSQEDNEGDLESIYTWSIYDDLESDDVNLEESYMRNIMKKSAATATGKPPLPPPRQRAYSTGNAGYHENYNDGKCKDHNLHKILGESCSRHDLEAISAFECDSNVQEGNLIVESLYKDEEHFLCKPNIIPCSSTQIQLQDKSSGSSSMDAKRASIPDLYSVSTPNNDYRSGAQTSNSNSTDSSPLQERLELVGKSSSSNEKDSSSNVPPPPSVTISSPNTDSHALVDSILTDSPNSVSSSGIFAPCNSPARNCSSSSKVSSSTTSGKNSADSNSGSKTVPVTLVTQPQPTVSAKLEQPQRTEEAVENVNTVFKVPKQSMPLKHLFKFRRHKCKTPDSLQSDPRILAPSVQSDPLSRRDHFPLLPSVRHEPRIVDKKAVIRKFKRFSETFYKRDKSGRVKIQTLANL
ncbi:hypothetical protein CHS0354_039594 [Potamilus streckersoni]|nr:hypothetical protein CHS0354_039594 [Potamilus streckersoni]